MPATFTVTTAADGGAGSLRAAVALANADPAPDRGWRPGRDYPAIE